VYGGRSRFLTEKVLKTLEPATFHGAASADGDALAKNSAPVTVDVSAKLRDMW
jgi:hypothetical protein